MAYKTIEKQLDEKLPTRSELEIVYLYKQALDHAKVGHTGDTFRTLDLIVSHPGIHRFNSAQINNYHDRVEDILRDTN